MRTNYFSKILALHKVIIYFNVFYSQSLTKVNEEILKMKKINLVEISAINVKWAYYWWNKINFHLLFQYNHNLKIKYLHSFIQGLDIIVLKRTILFNIT